MKFIKRVASLQLIFFLGIFCHLAQAQLDRFQILSAESSPDFSFKTAESKVHWLSEFKGKIVIVNFWATWCRYCVDEMSSLEKLAEQFEPDDFAILALCKDTDNVRKAQDIFEARDIKHMKLFFDESGSAFKNFKVKGLPTTLVFNRQGELIGRMEGSTVWDHWEVVDFMRTLIAGRTPETQGKWKRFFVSFKRMFSQT